MGSGDRHRARKPGPVRPNARVGVFSRGIMRAPHLGAHLGTEELIWRPGAQHAEGLDYVVAWGTRPSARRAERYAQRHGVPLVRLEDGFLRSVGLGVHGAPALSMAIDPLGVYYDCSAPSRLEAILLGHEPDSRALHDPAMVARATAAMEAIRTHGLSKYNDAPRAPTLPEAKGTARILIVDQTAGDMSLVRGGLTGPAPLFPLLDMARDAHPGATVYVKHHPDVTSGKKRSALGDRATHPDIEVLSKPCNPIELLDQFDHVYVGTSQLGFEALMLGKPVTCLGTPFYAGWGLTRDHAPAPRRGVPRSLTEVFIAAYLLYCRYVDPATGKPGTLEDVIEHLVRQRRMFERNAGRYFCFGFSSWKHAFVRRYLASPTAEVQFVRNAKRARKRGFDRDCVALVWGQKDTPAVRELVRDEGATLARMEDGFLRSVGLGSDLTSPASLVIDGRGIYYDPRRPSDLEHILQQTVFSEAELARARALRETLVAQRVSKYGFGTRAQVGVGAKAGQVVALVVGQVESDASIRLGCRDIATNLALLRAVREARPEAHLLFKAHPDVVSGNRKRGIAFSDLADACDELVLDARLHDCLDVAHEVHTMTSLVGFEALLRGLPVTTYGQPFYAGWGLTTDRHPPERRTRKLSLDALVAGALLRYPRYVLPSTGQFVEVETIVDLLAAGQGPRGRKPWLVRQLGRLTRAVVGHAGIR